MLVVLGNGHDEAEVGRNHPVLDLDEFALGGLALGSTHLELGDMGAKMANSLRNQKEGRTGILNAVLRRD